MLTSASSLVLNISWMPIEIVSWQDAITLYFAKNAKIISSYDFKVHSPSMSMKVPSVIMREDADYIVKAFTNVVPFNRYNLFCRDNGHCMYCGKKVALDDFTFEHVIPKDYGGKRVWENIVVACIRCNGKKRNRTPKEANMVLIREPFAPKLSKSVPKNVIKKLGLRVPHETWLDYIYWHIDLEKG